MKYHKRFGHAFLMLHTGVLLAAGLQAWGWAETVNWQGPSGSKIKEIRYFEKDTPQPAPQELAAQAEAAEPVYSNVIDSPPVDGFVPWIIFTVTDDRNGEFEPSAVPHLSVVGDYYTSSPLSNYAVGLLDTGASATVLSYQASNITGIYAHSDETLTQAVTEIQGVSGSVFTWVSQPLGLFIDGLQALDPNSLNDPNDWVLDVSNMVGLGNVSVSVGDMPEPNAPDLPNAIGAPMTVNLTTVISNDRKLWCKYAGETYTGPCVDFYEPGDPQIPDYSIEIPLNLIPLGSSDIQYIPDLELLMNELIYQPGTPSIIMGASAQSLFFVNSVSLYDDGYSATQQDRFMLDTGAQVTVVGSNVGSLLGFDPENPEFEVDIIGVTGETTVAPGFYIDSLDIPALGQWLQYTNIPVILLDVASPEGGTLDGIIGMNLFNEYNMVLKGDYASPTLQVQHIGPAVPGDIAPELRDFTVDLIDFVAFSQAWMSDGQSINWNPYADMAPETMVDGFVDIQDLSVLAENWLTGVSL
ncbi:MAG: retropepsin-like aspartic protease [Planctomycetota bacterium]